MNIGFVTTWLPRGAAYVTINYIKLLEDRHKTFIYARGGEYFDELFNYNNVPVHKGLRLEGTNIDDRDFINWIKSNKLDIVLLNEQDSIEAICVAKKKCKNVIFGGYVDYYKESTINDFKIYDFLICNTKRHMRVFDWHPQCLYLPWGTDINLYTPSEKKNIDKKIVFFHSMGMSDRKGTKELINVFINNRMSKMGAELVIHTQKSISHLISEEKAKQNGIEIICKSVPAPGLYYLGDVYVYPAKLDGLGLTMYEALACGLPVIATDVAPMNEVVNNNNGRLVRVKESFSRSDGYYWPLAIVDEESLKDAMLYYIQNANKIGEFSEIARKYASDNLNLMDRRKTLQEFIKQVKRIDTTSYENEWEQQHIKEKRSIRNHFLVSLLPAKLESYIRERIEKVRKNNA